jgi:hypothetical protein
MFSSAFGALRGWRIVHSWSALFLPPHLFDFCGLTSELFFILLLCLVLLLFGLRWYLWDLHHRSSSILWCRNNLQLFHSVAVLPENEKDLLALFFFGLEGELLLLAIDVKVDFSSPNVNAGLRGA